jgi:gamma-glutamylcyclotransferase (GGCT)/AIG2-like uncharacterized protein YtfP
VSEAKFFVYGSLSEGFVHFSRIKEFIIDQQEGSLIGSVFRLKVGYPVLLEDGQDLIRGQIVTVKSSEILLGLLDAFHSFFRDDPAKCLYFRKFLAVRTAVGEALAQVYVLNPMRLPTDSILIKDGDWQTDLKVSPALPAKLTDKQRTYVQKLGASSGREIVPIDLTLYRELMNLELIVDKGRRLALSKLGQEVYRYLL